MTPAAALAAEMLAARDAATLIGLPTRRDGGLTLAQAFAVADEIRRLRSARGERPMGWKIGFTNCSIWAKYGVHAPIWAPVWDTTTKLLDAPTAAVSLAGLVQPRIEPEIQFGFAHAPRAGMDESELQRCLAWVAHGFEIVQTHFAGWRFDAADTVADFGLHGRLFVGPRVPIERWKALGADLASLRVDLLRDGTAVETGSGAHVLDGPLNALRLWIDAMALQSPDWRVEAGDVVSTGTLTDAWPIASGERWSTVPSDRRLAGMTLDVNA